MSSFSRGSREADAHGPQSGAPAPRARQGAPAAPGAGPVPAVSGTLLDLQRAAGNRAVVSLLGRGSVIGPAALAPQAGLAPQGGLAPHAGLAPGAVIRRVGMRGFSPGSPFGAGAAAGVSPVLTERIQRHASWEHKMLGDVDPAELEVIAAARDVVAERQNADKENRPRQTLRTEGGKVLDADTVLHAIEQEITRLRVFAKDPPKVATGKEEQRLVQKDERRQDRDNLQKGVEAPAQKWEVRLVAVPLRDGTEAVLTYGEVNTLADFFGSTDQIRETDPAQFRSYVAGIREESIRKFMRLHTEVATGLGREAKYDADDERYAVSLDGNRSMGNTGTSGSLVIGGVAGGDAYGELKMMGKVPNANESELAEKRYELPGKSETSYTAGLGRNACHFAPQSWHAWAEAHNKAIELATRAYKIRDNLAWAADLYTGEEFGEEAKKADKLENEALLENGFGDHFLQDSFAAGHLINKTLIMQWFTKWLDENWNKRMYTSEGNWRRVQNIAYGQEGIAGKGLYNAPIGETQSNDAQSVENMGGSWQDRFNALGLRVPPSLSTPGSATRELFSWWQARALKNPDKAKSDVDDLAAGPIRNRRQLEAALKALIEDGVVYYDRYSTSDRRTGAESIGLSNLLGAKGLRLKAEYIPKTRGRLSEQAYTNKAQAVTYGDYHTFLNHGYLQLSTNVLHDWFCKNGLWVNTESGRTGYKIYGDNSMLQTESAKMVKWSGQTSHMSRDSITQLANRGETGNTTAAIAARIPKYVSTVKGGTTIGLDAWHGESKAAGLKKLCWETVFPEASAFFSKSTAIASDTLAPKISKDTEAGEPF